jgi:hypothetical protein
MRDFFFRRKQLNFHEAFLILLFLWMSFEGKTQSSIHCDFEIGPEISAITNQSFNPGDTLCLMDGNRGPLYLKNVLGTEEQPIVLINKDGQVLINSDLSYGLKFAQSKNIIISGSGNQNDTYGIAIQSVTQGSGLQIGDLSTNFEVEHLEIANVKITGIVAKTDPNCIYAADRANFTMYNVNIHDNYIHHTGNEGMYIGSSFFLGQYISDCDTTLFPHIIDGVQIYNNRVEYTGWDGIQVGSALYNCAVHDNAIYKDSQAEASYQMSGIIINPGSSCNVFNNRIIDGQGTGIINQGSGGQKIYNNLIVNAGRTFDFDNQTTEQEFGIFSKYAYILPPDSSFQFFNNTIINPKSDGIRFMNAHSENNLFINNIIINPGAYDYYKNLGSVNFEAQDAYIHNYLDMATITAHNNIFARSSKNQYFADTLNADYHLTAQSPAVNSGYNLSEKGITFDLENKSRPNGNDYDIGAYEFQIITGVDVRTSKSNPLKIQPNPAENYLNLKFYLKKDQKLSLKIISITGKEFPIFASEKFKAGENRRKISLSKLPKAVYILFLYNENKHFSQKFQKI